MQRKEQLTAAVMLLELGRAVNLTGPERSNFAAALALCSDLPELQALMQQAAAQEGDSLSTAALLAKCARLAAVKSEGHTAAEDAKRLNPQDRLQSIFNELFARRGRQVFPLALAAEAPGLCLPEENAALTSAEEAAFYQNLEQRLRACLQDFKESANLSALLFSLEDLTAYLPAFAGGSVLSLFLKLKLTAAAAACFYDYLKADELDLSQSAPLDEDKLLSAPAFLLCACDISGIQSFIYTITSKGALKSLRARSFYLEIILEQVIDELLSRLSLTRANLLYAGGGHCYLLLPHTEQTEQQFKAAVAEVNAWFAERWDIALYLAAAAVPCSADELADAPRGSYQALYTKLAQAISECKRRRYDAAAIERLNRRTASKTRECVICRRSHHLLGDTCALCSALIAFSQRIVDADAFAAVRTSDEPLDTPALPFGCVLTALKAADLEEAVHQPSFVRGWRKSGREVPAGLGLVKLHFGDYQDSKLLNEYAEDTAGIKRLAIFRADVDNLGAVFAQGLSQGRGRSSLAGSAALSQALTLYFKERVSALLRQGELKYFSGGGPRRLTLVYSGGDDLFMLGAWQDTLDAMLELRRDFAAFTQGKLTLSGGLKLYRHNFPISVMAKEVEELVDCAKSRPGKNAIALLMPEFVYSWDDFTRLVLEDKYPLIDGYLSQKPQGAQQDQLGKAFLYDLLEQFTGAGASNRAHLVYMLSRLQPSFSVRQERPELDEAYRDFARRLYEAYRDKSARRDVVLALYLYLYQHRGEAAKSAGDA